MLLKDLVWRSALHRGAGETEVSSFAPQVFEVTDLPIPAGTDWSTDGHVLGTIDLDAGSSALFSLYLRVDAPLADGDRIYLGEWPTPGNAAGSNDYSVPLDAANAPAVVSQMLQWKILPNLGPNPTVNSAVSTKTTVVVPASTQQVGLFNDGASVNDITVVLARAVFLVL